MNNNTVIQKETLINKNYTGSLYANLVNNLDTLIIIVRQIRALLLLFSENCDNGINLL